MTKYPKKITQSLVLYKSRDTNYTFKKGNKKCKIIYKFKPKPINVFA